LDDDFVDLDPAEPVASTYSKISRSAIEGEQATITKDKPSIKEAELIEEAG